MAKTNYFVYAHINRINRKVYVGISKNPIARWGKNGCLYKGSVFGKAINKYGWDNFDHMIIEDDVTLNQAKVLEKLYIKALDSKVPNGYNVTDGGEGTQGYHLAEGTKRRISEKMKVLRKGVKFSDEHKNNLREARRKMLARKQANGEKLPAKRMPVLQFSKNGNLIAEFESVSDAYRKLGICHIYDVCYGTRKTAGGYVWKWRETYNAQVQ